MPGRWGQIQCGLKSASHKTLNVLSPKEFLFPSTNTFMACVWIITFIKLIYTCVKAHSLIEVFNDIAEFS